MQLILLFWRTSVKSVQVNSCYYLPGLFNLLIYLFIHNEHKISIFSVLFTMLDDERVSVENAQSSYPLNA